MKKAVVVGGSNGIGLSIVNDLQEKNYHVYILDVCEPNKQLIINDKYTYIYCNLFDFDEDTFKPFIDDKEVSFLMITAGIGRVADFEYLHIAEIEKTLKINTVATIKVLRLFYDRITSQERFYCGIMGSIAGLVSSPMFSVYSASKAAICRFVESINIELAANSSLNRILNVSPGSIKGTRFNGGENDLSQTKQLAKQIVAKILNSEELFIPDYEEVYKGVLDRYHQDPHAFGFSSYQYKKQSGRAKNEYRVCIGYLSGTFDLFHIGHLNLLKRAKAQCDYLIVGVHCDASHKGKETFISLEERMAIVGSCKYVDKVVQSCREDSDAWDLYRYNKLFVGSDYKGTERFKTYEKYFEERGVEIIYFPYTQGTSSSQLRNILTTKLEEKKR